MSERKVLSKYYPPDFDPSRVGRSRAPKQTGPKVQVVRLGAPFSMKCTSCGEYIGTGRRFNARKETPVDEKYMGIQIYRFYIRCTRCSAEIVFKTDPRTANYTVERGALRNTDPWRRGLEDPLENETDEQRLDRIEREMAEAEGQEERNAMAELEAKTADAKREMAVADALDEIRSRNARLEQAKAEGVDLEALVAPGLTEEEQRRKREEEEDAEAARRAFAFARGVQEEMLIEEVPEEVEVENGGVGRLGGGSSSDSGSTTSNGVASTTSTTATTISPPVAAVTKPAPVAATAGTKRPATDSPADMPPPTFKRQVKKKKDHAALLGIKKKQPLV